MSDEPEQAPYVGVLTEDGRPAVTLVKRDPTSPGRPAIHIDEVTLYELALTHASYTHMGRILGVSSTVLYDNAEYREIILKARAVQKKHLLAAQFSAAITDRNPTMLIWMGKQYLGQKDVQRVENTGAEGGPQKHQVDYKAVAYFPDNGRNKKLPSGTATLLNDNGTMTDIPAEEVLSATSHLDKDDKSTDFYRDDDM